MDNRFQLTRLTNCCLPFIIDTYVQLEDKLAHTGVMALGHMDLYLQLRGPLHRQVSQIRAPLVACREPVGSYNRLSYVLYVFEHKMQYILIHAPYTHIVTFWHISNMSP